MGVLTRLGGVFRKKPAGSAAAPPPNPAAVPQSTHRPVRATPNPPARPGALGVEPPSPPARPAAPVEVLAAEDADARSRPRTPDDALAVTPKNRQELLTELQKNYAEVVSLIRKVDQHLDAQERRSARLMEIAESIPPALQALPAVRDEAERIGQRLDALLAAQGEQASEAQTTRRAQVEALGDVRTLLESTQEAERRVAESLDAFKNSVGSMSEATGAIGSVLRTMREQDAKRDDRLAELVAGNNRAMMTIVAIIGVVLVVAVVLAVVVLL